MCIFPCSTSYSYSDYCGYSSGSIIAVCQANCIGSENNLSSCDILHSCSSLDYYDYYYRFSYSIPCTHDNDVILHCCKFLVLCTNGSICLWRCTNLTIYSYQPTNLYQSDIIICMSFMYSYIV